MISWYRRQPTGRRVFWMLAAILAAVIAANAPSLFRAVESWTGYGPPPPALPDEAVRPQNPDWQVFVAFAPAGPLSGKLDLWASSAKGTWISGADARARFVHATGAGQDFEIALPQRVAGNYGAKVDLPVGGAWDVDIWISHGGNRYRTSRRIQLP